MSVVRAARELAPAGGLRRAGGRTCPTGRGHVGADRRVSDSAVTTVGAAHTVRAASPDRDRRPAG